MFDVAHRPVYGSATKDELICSCGWSGPTYAVPAHYETAARQARQRIAFVDFVEERSEPDDWSAIGASEGQPAFLSPLQFAAAMRDQGFA